MTKRFCVIGMVVLLATCSDGSHVPAYRIEGAIEIDGISRYYLLNLPPGYQNATDLPLVVALHGTGGSALQMENDYGLTEKAKEKGFAIVYPEGVRRPGMLGLRTWNAGECCDFAMENNIDDVRFIRSLLDRLETHFNINSNRIYLTGMSNGAMMAYRLACELSDRIAAIAPVSGSMMVSQPCNPARSVSILHIHSELDAIVPALGGIGIGGYNFPSVDSTLGIWVDENQCTVSPIVISEEHFRYKHWQGCANAAVISYYLTRDGGHSWPGGQKSRAAADEPSQAFGATEVIFEFFDEGSGGNGP